jgi:hypothetical protein
MRRIDTKLLISLMIIPFAALTFSDVHAAMARVDEPACVGFNGQALGLCVEGCAMTTDGRDLSSDYEALAESFEKKVGAPFQCDEPQAGSVCFSAAENICAGVLADTTDGFRRVSRKHKDERTQCSTGQLADSEKASCEVQKWVSKDGKTTLIHTACNDGLERCERRRGRDRAKASLCHERETAKVADEHGAVCNTSRLR